MNPHHDRDVPISGRVYAHTWPRSRESQQHARPSIMPEEECNIFSEAEAVYDFNGDESEHPPSLRTALRRRASRAQLRVMVNPSAILKEEQVISKASLPGVLSKLFEQSADGGLCSEHHLQDLLWFFVPHLVPRPTSLLKVLKSQFAGSMAHSRIHPDLQALHVAEAGRLLEGVHSWLVGNRAVLTDDTLAERLHSWFSEEVRRYFPGFADQLLEVISGTRDIRLVARTSTFQGCTPRRAVGATQSRRVQSVYGEDGYLVQRPFNANSVSRDMADQLTLVFHRAYLALPRPSQLVADWMIGGRERKFASPEVALIDLSDDLTKLVAASLRLVARDSRLLEDIAARWLDVEKECFGLGNFAAAFAIHQALDFVHYRPIGMTAGRSLHGDHGGAASRSGAAAEPTQKPSTSQTWIFGLFRRDTHAAKEHSPAPPPLMFTPPPTRSGQFTSRSAYFKHVKTMGDVPYIPILLHHKMCVTLASDDRPPILGLDGQGDAILDVAVLRRVATHMHALEQARRPYDIEPIAPVLRRIHDGLTEAHGDPPVGLVLPPVHYAVNPAFATEAGLVRHALVAAQKRRDAHRLEAERAAAQRTAQLASGHRGAFQERRTHSEENIHGSQRPHIGGRKPT